jgi:hypothetical protein
MWHSRKLSAKFFSTALARKKDRTHFLGAIWHGTMPGNEN